MNRKRRALRLAIAGVTLLGLAACGSQANDANNPDSSAPAGTASRATGVDALYKAAKDEGSLTWYSSHPPYDAIEKFKEEYPGIDVDILRLAAGPLATRFSQERDAGTVPADVIDIANDEFIDNAVKKGWLEPSPNLPALSKFPKKYYSNGIVTLSISPVGIAYNTDMVKGSDVPKDWQDILNPKFRGKAMMPDPRDAPVYLHVAALWKKTYGPEFLTKVGNMEPTLAASQTPILQKVAAGGAAITFMASFASTDKLTQSGAPIKWVLPSPSTGSVFYGAVVKGAEHPAAAELFLNFLMTEEGQLAFNPGSVSPLGNIGHNMDIPKGFETLPYKQVEKQLDEIATLLKLPPGGH